jgi:hypothetical protein
VVFQLDAVPLHDVGVSETAQQLALLQDRLQG